MKSNKFRDPGRNYKYNAIINPTQPRYLGRKHIIAKTEPDKIKTLANFATVPTSVLHQNQTKTTFSG